ncbi:MAG TPA: protein kinase, partial [Ktedonobacteraceae bacterium]|nr:protein kinase [Ktedonobacteraceae bacterium]
SLACDICGTVNPMSRTHCLACGQVLAASNASDSLALSPTASALSSTLLKQRYRVMHIIGKGGMGTVYIGIDTLLGNRLVAIKEMSQNGLVLSERLEAARLFQREAHLLAGLQHPNLPGIYDHFEEGQRWYLVMSFIKGQTLTDYLESRGGKLPVAEVLEIGITLCSVLDYLHSSDPPIIFRDLKPANIMRTVEGHIYVIDFGIARFFKPGKAGDTAWQGSSGYASPEQYGITQTTPRSDLYSLGATLYHLLSGYELSSTPFSFPPLQELVPAAPAQLVTLVTEMLDLEEARRPASAAAVRQELQKIVSSGAALAPFSPSSPLPALPARKKIRPGKKRALFLVVPLLCLLLLAGALSLFWKNLQQPASNTPAGVVNTFCNAMNSQAPDYLTAYHQLSQTYQRAHSLIAFQQDLLGTSACVVASAPNSDNQAVLSLTMLCPPPPPDAGIPPPTSPPPPRIVPVDLTLVNERSNDWKIDTLLIIGRNCRPPSGSSAN